MEVSEREKGGTRGERTIVMEEGMPEEGTGFCVNSNLTVFVVVVVD